MNKYLLCAAPGILSIIIAGGYASSSIPSRHAEIVNQKEENLEQASELSDIQAKAEIRKAKLEAGIYVSGLEIIINNYTYDPDVPPIFDMELFPDEGINKIKDRNNVCIGIVINKVFTFSKEVC